VITDMTAKTRTRNRRGEGVLLRDEIVAAAERILEREGTEEAITLRSVAREAGIAAPSIYSHFDDRQAILDAVVDNAFEMLRAAIVASKSPSGDPVEALLSGCRAYFAFAEAEPTRYKTLFNRPATAAETPAVPEGAPPPWQHRLAAFEILVGGIANCAAAGRSASTDPFADAALLWTAMHGAVSLLHYVPGFPWPPVDHMLNEMVHRLARLT
jgi:AcrR family transcriptional regulator